MLQSEQIQCNRREVNLSSHCYVPFTSRKLFLEVLLLVICSCILSISSLGAQAQVL